MKLFTAFLLLVCGYAYGQEFSDPDLQSLVEAERSFSKMAKDKNTQDAFLHFFADDVVTASPGKGPRKGKDHLEKQSVNDSWLYWEPAYSDIAASGDFGFNLGPWQFRKKKTDDEPVSFGHFVSMWKKNDRGEWKVVIDIGISHDAPKKEQVLRTSKFKLSRQPFGPEQKDYIFNLEKKFVDAFEKNGNAAYDRFLSDESKFFRPGNEPYCTHNEVQWLLENSKEKINYTLIGGDVSASGDLAYVYGEAFIETIDAGVTKTTQHCYMRFWKKDEGDNWKIVVDLISN